MMKKVSLSHLLSRSPRHGTNCGRRRSASAANGDVLLFVGSSSPSPVPPADGTGPSPSSSSSSTLNNSSNTINRPTNDQHKNSIIIKKKSKTGILQTLKKKITGKFDTFQNSNSSSTPKKSKSFEGLSNSFGESLSQSVSEESSSDGLNASGGQSHKSKHSKRAIRPIHPNVTSQNSSSHVLTDSESEVLSRLVHGDHIKSPITVSESSAFHLRKDTSKSIYNSNISSPVVYESGKTDNGGYSGVDSKIEVPRVLVENVGEESNDNGAANRTNTLACSPTPNAISETSSPLSNRSDCGDLWDIQNANLDASRRSLAEELFRLSKFGWYWGPITRAEAEEKLVDQPDGAFLVRDSSDDKYLLSLSFRSFNKTLHTRIEHSNGWFSFYPHPEHEGHTSLVGLIDHCMSHSESGVFCYSRARVPGSPSFPVRLTKAVSRFTQVRSLQYLCRFVIRQYTRVDHIQALPLPTRIKGYLEEGHF